MAIRGIPWNVDCSTIQMPPGASLSISSMNFFGNSLCPVLTWSTALYPFWLSVVAAFTEPDHASPRTPAPTLLSPSCASSISPNVQAAVAPNVAQCLCARIPSLLCWISSARIQPILQQAINSVPKGNKVVNGVRWRSEHIKKENSKLTQRFRLSNDIGYVW